MSVIGGYKEMEERMETAASGLGFRTFTGCSMLYVQKGYEANMVAHVSFIGNGLLPLGHQ